MTHDTPLALTPEQIAAVNAGGGVVHALDPSTKRRYVLLEQRQEARLTESELREMLRVGIDQLDRGEGRPWDPEEVKESLRQRFQERGLA